MKVASVTAGPPAEITLVQVNNGLPPTGSSTTPAIFNGCPVGTKFYFSDGSVPLWAEQGTNNRATSYHWGGIWLDHSNWVATQPFGGDSGMSPGSSLASALTSVPAMEGQYMTNVAGTNARMFFSATFAENSTSDTASGCANDAKVLLNVTCANIGVIGTGVNEVGGYLLSTSAASGSTTLTFPGPLPTWINVGWNVVQYTSDRCLQQTTTGGVTTQNSTWGIPIQSYDKVAHTVTLNSTYGQVGTIPATGCNTTSDYFLFGDGTHTDTWFTTTPSGENMYFLDHFTCSNCYAEGFFTQQGPKFNYAVRNSAFPMLNSTRSSGGDYALALNAPSDTNFVVRNVGFNTGVTPPTGATFSGTVNLSGTFSDVYFLADQCPASPANPITNYPSLPAGITVDNTGGGSC